MEGTGWREARNCQDEWEFDCSNSTVVKAVVVVVVVVENCKRDEMTIMAITMTATIVVAGVVAARKIVSVKFVKSFVAPLSPSSSLAFVALVVEEVVEFDALRVMMTHGHFESGRWSSERVVVVGGGDDRDVDVMMVGIQR